MSKAIEALKDKEKMDKYKKISKILGGIDIIECECGNEGIMIECDSDDSTLSLCFFQRGHDQRKLSWRYIFKIIKSLIFERKFSYVDMITLNKDKINEFIRVLEKNKQKLIEVDKVWDEQL